MVSFKVLLERGILWVGMRTGGGGEMEYLSRGNEE